MSSPGVHRHFSTPKFDKEPFVLCDKYTKLQVKKEDGTTVAAITTDDWDMADGYTIVLIPNYEYKD